jgi:hypothetical protein
MLLSYIKDIHEVALSLALCYALHFDFYLESGICKIIRWLSNFWTVQLLHSQLIGESGSMGCQGYFMNS